MTPVRKMGQYADRSRMHAKQVTLIIILVFGLLLCLEPSRVLAFPVPSLPKNNLISNPWFRDTSDPSRPGLDGWKDAAGLDKYWSTSQKESNPSPDIVISAMCAYEQAYCGTAARLHPTSGQTGGIGVPGVDAYLFQVVSAEIPHQKIKFFAHWVSHRVIVAEVNVYASDSPTGPWTLKWVPFYHTQDTNPPAPPGGQGELWQKTDFLEISIGSGYSYYKIEVHARFPDPEDGAAGFKITGVYFATDPGSKQGTPKVTNTPAPTTPVKTPSPHHESQLFLPLIQLLVPAPTSTPPLFPYP